MSTSIIKHLPAKERRVLTVEAVGELAGEQNPNDITTAAIAKHMGLTLISAFPKQRRDLPSGDGMDGDAPVVSGRYTGFKRIYHIGDGVTYGEAGEGREFDEV